MTKSQHDQDSEDYHHGLQGTNTGSAMNQQGLSDRDSCFPSDTEVLTLKGWCQIDDLIPGDFVQSYHPSGRIVCNRIIKRTDHALTKIYKVHFEDGHDTLRATGSHAVLTDRSWQKVRDLKPGDRLASVTERKERLTQTVRLIEEQSCRAIVHNLIVEGNYTFIVRGCVAHSFSHFRELRMFAYEAKRIIVGAFVNSPSHFEATSR